MDFLEKILRVTPLLLKFAPTGFLGSGGGEIYAVFDEESESEVENIEILRPDLEIQENHKKLEILISPYFPNISIDFWGVL